jgi:peptidoglycan/xylan/chitin deacetylase (PgdA/CDA1 family)
LLGQAWAVRNRAEALGLTPSLPTTLEPSERDAWAFTHFFKKLLEEDIARESAHKILTWLADDELKGASLQQFDPASLRRELEHIYDVLEASPVPFYGWSSLKRFFDNDQLAKLVGVSPSSVQRYRKGERDTPQDVAERLAHIREADLEGHEIANHACGHFDGGAWSKAEWLHEFSQFDRIVADAYEINGIAGEPEGWRALAASMNGGFRAPYLSVGDGLFSALHTHGFAYDASTVSRGPAAPAAQNGIATFALPMIPEGPESRPVLAMDYNLFVRHSGGFERKDKDGAFEERTYRAFRDAFSAEYAGARTPLQIGFHFTLMNGGAYWNALERFVREVCVKPDVACVSYRDAMATDGTDMLTTGQFATD